MKNEILEFALSLARAAEAEILPVFRKCTISLKSDGTEVTEADRRAEEAMRARIEKQFPKHRILGEEFGGSQEPTNDPVWVLDPIDGTTSFAIGLPIFGTLIAYLEGGKPLVGVIHFPAMGETVFAAKGSGCWAQVHKQDPQRVHTSGIVSLADAFVSAGGVTPTDIQPAGNPPSFKLSSVIPKSRKFRVIADCVQHALVAQGRIDAAIDPVMNPWDIAALIPCIEEAGGVVTDLNGSREHLTWCHSLLSSASEPLHAQILRVLQGIRL
jgi:histidinol-phosphatase